MPKVPIAKAGRISTRALPNARFTTNSSVEAFGGGRQNVTNAANRLATSVSAIVAKEQEKAKRSRVGEAKVDYHKLRRDLAKGKFNPDGSMSSPGFQSSQGKDSAEQLPEYNSKYDAGDSEILSRYQNDPEMYEAVKIISQSSRISYDDTMIGHASSQSQAYDKEVINAQMEIANEEASLGYDHDIKDDKVFTKNIGEVSKLADQLSDQQGSSAEATALNRKLARSSISLSVLNQMVNNEDDQLAKSHFNKYKKEFTKNDLNKAKALVEESSSRGDSQRFTDDVMSRGLSEQEAIAFTREKLEGKAEDDVISRIKTRYSEVKSISKEAENNLFNDSYNTLTSDPRHDAIKPSDWIKLTPSHQKVLRNFLKQKASGKDVQTQLPVYKKLSDMKAYNHDKFLKVNMLDFADKLSSSDWKKFQNEQNNMKKSSGEAKLKADGFKTDREIVKDGLSQYGYDVSNNAGKDDRNAVISMEHEIDSRVEVWKRDNGKTFIDPESLKTIVDSVAQPVTTIEKGFIWDTQVKKPAFSVPLADRNTSFIEFEDIPQDQVRAIRDTYTRKGLEAPSNDQIQQNYMTFINQQVNK